MAGRAFPYLESLMCLMEVQVWFFPSCGVKIVMRQPCQGD